MIILRQYILGLTNDTNKRINKDIHIENGVVYINSGEHQYKYENDCYFINVDGKWINLQGGTPFYEVEENLDENIFIDTEAEEIDNGGE